MPRCLGAMCPSPRNAYSTRLQIWVSGAPTVTVRMQSCGSRTDTAPVLTRRADEGSKGSTALVAPCTIHPMRALPEPATNSGLSTQQYHMVKSHSKEEQSVAHGTPS